MKAPMGGYIDIWDKYMTAKLYHIAGQGKELEPSAETIQVE